MIDKQGKIMGRISIVDIVIIIVVIALGIGFAYRRLTPSIINIIQPSDSFHVTFEVNRIRSVIAEDTVVVGDMVFRQHTRQALGTIIAVDRLPATEVMQRTDGTAILATMEGRYSLRITIEATGTINASGFLANGNDHLAPGGEVALINSRFIFPLARVYAVSLERP